MQAVSQLGLFCHKKQGNEEKVIAYFCRSLNRTQRQYCKTRRELLAVVKTLAHFHPYLYGRNFVVRTDHCSLRWLVNFKYAGSKVGVIGRYDNTTSADVAKSFTRGSFNTSSQSPDWRTFWN